MTKPKQQYHNATWEKPERQSPVAILLILIQFAAKVLKLFWPIILIMLFRQNPGKGDPFTTTTIYIALGSTILSIIAYFNFYFYVKDEELVIRKGIFRKVHLNIPFDRIQTINFRQNPIHRFFNVVSLEIDTAGSRKKEFSILALNKDKAEAIRNFLIAQMPITHKQLSAHETPNTPHDKTLLHLSFTDLLKISLGQNHLRGLGIIAAATFAILEVLGKDRKGISKMCKEIFNKEKNTIQEAELWGYLFVALLLFLLFTSFLNTLLKHYDLRFLKNAKGFKVISGLFNRREQSAAMEKIQMIQWTTNPLKQLFKMYDLRLLQASAARIMKKQSFYVPGCYAPQVQAVREAYMPGEANLFFEVHRISRRLMNKQVLLYGLLPLLLLALSAFAKGNNFSFFYLLWFPIVVFGSWIYYKRYRYMLSEKGLRLQRGVFVTKHTLLKYYKIQGLQIRQSIFQQRNAHADLKIYTAAGSLLIPYIEIQKARTLANVLLYQVESTKKNWM